jgi:hypothetical protein
MMMMMMHMHMQEKMSLTSNFSMTETWQFDHDQLHVGSIQEQPKDKRGILVSD